MPSYSASGEENLRADAKVYAGSENASPSGKGKDAGGTANLGATTKVMSNPGKSTTVYAKDSRPAGVDHFDGGVA